MASIFRSVSANRSGPRLSGPASRYARSAHRPALAGRLRSGIAHPLPGIAPLVAGETRRCTASICRSLRENHRRGSISPEIRSWSTVDSWLPSRKPRFAGYRAFAPRRRKNFAAGPLAVRIRSEAPICHQAGLAPIAPRGSFCLRVRRSSRSQSLCRAGCQSGTRAGPRTTKSPRLPKETRAWQLRPSSLLSTIRRSIRRAFLRHRPSSLLPRRRPRGRQQHDGSPSSRPSYRQGREPPIQA